MQAVERERGGFVKRWRICKYASREHFERGEAYEESVFGENLLLNEGITEALKLIGGLTATAFNQANAHLGVGDSDAAESATQTGLQASTNKVYRPVESGYPVVTNQTITWRAVFGETVGNFNWREFTVANGSSDSAVNLNRKVSNQGTKASGQIWTLNLELTLS